MNDHHYRALLDLRMCSDPWPTGVDQDAVDALLDHEARERGFDNWIAAYHGHNPNPDPPCPIHGDLGGDNYCPRC